MPSTTTLQKVMNATRPYLKMQPLDFANQEPALEAGNIVLQTMLGAPFCWPWNRNTFSFVTVIGQCDYVVAIPDFGFLETQWIVDAAGKVHQCGGATKLPKATSASKSRPTTIAIQKDDNQGNLTFRLDKMPDAVYTVSGDYQRQAPVLQSVATLISPIPDNLRFVFAWGFLTLMGQLVNDVRVDWWEKKFSGRLLALQDGLDEVAINIFLGLWQNNMKTIARTQGAVQSGTAGRQV